MQKIFYFDCETTGVDHKKNALIQLAAIVTYNDKIVEVLNLKMQPHKGAVIDEKALEIHGMNRDTLKTFMPPTEGFLKLMKLLNTHINRFDRNDKMYVGGFNVRFDLNFLTEFFKRFSDSRYGLGPYFNWRILDPLPIMHFLDRMGSINLPNYKLTTCCNYFGITLEGAHDALADVLATIHLIQHIQQFIVFKEQLVVAKKKVDTSAVQLTGAKKQKLFEKGV